MKLSNKSCAARKISKLTRKNVAGSGFIEIWGLEWISLMVGEG
jgi:hypothetical protein